MIDYNGLLYGLVDLVRAELTTLVVHFTWLAGALSYAPYLFYLASFVLTESSPALPLPLPLSLSPLLY